MSEFRVNSITNQDGSAGPQVCGVSTFSGKSGIQIPSGPTDFRRQDGGRRGRGLFAGGETPSLVNTIQFVVMSSQGGSNDFGGTLSFGKIGHNGAVANSTRAVTAGGYLDPNYSSQIEFVTIMSTGDANDFGDLTVPKYAMGSFSSPTRGLFCGGDPGTSPNTTDDVDFIEIATLGNAVDFGDLKNNSQHGNSTASSVRFVSMGGATPSSPYSVPETQYANFATGGTALSLGDLTQARWSGDAACSNAHGGLG